MSSSRSSRSRSRKRGSATPSSARPSTNTNTTRSSGPYDRNFQQNLIDSGVYPYAYEYPDGRVPGKPDNWEEINERLAQPRRSLSPLAFTEEAHEKFIRADAHAFKEKQISESVIPIIEGKIEDSRCTSRGIPFTNLDHLTDGTLVPGNPDRYYGARPEQLNRQVRNKLSGHIIPSTQHDLPIAPNFFLAVKGPDGSAAVAARQACYDGALGARGMHSLQSYGQEKPVYDNKAYTITSIYHNGQLKMYTVHPAQPNGPGSRPEYYMTQLKGWSMTSDPETFRKGATAFRNARDWAREQRDQAIEKANQRVDANLAGSLTVDTSSSLEIETPPDESPTIETLSQESHVNVPTLGTTILSESETSTDELALDNRLPAKRSRRQSCQSQRKRRNADKSSDAGHSN